MASKTKTAERRAYEILVRALDRKNLGLVDAVRILAASAVYIGRSVEELAALGIDDAKAELTAKSDPLGACLACGTLQWLSGPQAAAAPQALGVARWYCEVDDCDGFAHPLPPKR